MTSEHSHHIEKTLLGDNWGCFTGIYQEPVIACAPNNVISHLGSPKSLLQEKPDDVSPWCCFQYDASKHLGDSTGLPRGGVAAPRSLMAGLGEEWGGTGPWGAEGSWSGPQRLFWLPKAALMSAGLIRSILTACVCITWWTAWVCVGETSYQNQRHLWWGCSKLLSAMKWECVCQWMITCLLLYWLKNHSLCIKA